MKKRTKKVTIVNPLTGARERISVRDIEYYATSMSGADAEEWLGMVYDAMARRDAEELGRLVYETLLF